MDQDEEDDDVSFLSISESDDSCEIDIIGEGRKINSKLETEETRPSSPTCSLSSVRSFASRRSSTKRIAPQPPPPPAAIIPTVVSSMMPEKTNSHKSKVATKSRISQVVPSGVKTKGASLNVRDKRKPSSRDFPNVSSIDEEVKTPNGDCCPTKVVRPINDLVTVSDTPLIPPWIPSVAENELSTTLDYSYAPVYFSTVTSHPAEFASPLVSNAPVLSMIPENASRAIDATNTAISVLVEPLPPGLGLGKSDSSDLTKDQIAAKSLPPARRDRLASLSEEEEGEEDETDEMKDEEDGVYSDVVYDHRRSSTSNWKNASVSYDDDDLRFYRNKSRISRSDSNVTVAHLCEDLLVSSRFKLKLTFTNLTVVVIVAVFLIPNSASLIFNFFRLIFGTLFPAYYSYKAVRTKNVKEYVKWMMYWIVFAIFTCVETVTDVLVSFWFPFYYEIKILVVLWLLSPATKGSSIMYRKFVHPWLTKREEEIDDCIAKAKEQGYSTVVQLGTKGVNYATTVIMQTAIKGGGGIVSQLKRSYSVSEITEDAVDLGGGDVNRNIKALPSSHTYNMTSDEEDVSSGSLDVPRQRAESECSSSRMTRGQSTGRISRASKTRSADVSDIYFHDATEAMTTTTQRRSPRAHDAMSASTGGGNNHLTRRSRTTEVSKYATLPRTTSKRTGTTKKKQT